jgi:hypothetical protein
MERNTGESRRLKNPNPSDNETLSAEYPARNVLIEGQSPFFQRAVFFLIDKLSALLAGSMLSYLLSIVCQ